MLDEEPVAQTVSVSERLVNPTLGIIRHLNLAADIVQESPESLPIRQTEGFLNPIWLPALLFLMSAVMAFSTGTSWGTFAIMLPIGIPMAEALGIDLRPMIGAVIGGSIFGDHCSPISDTTIVASLAAGSDHIDHVNTQLPYALAVAAVSTILFVAAAALL